MNIKKLVISIIIPFLASAIGGFFTVSPWYEILNKPFFNPPGWIFGPVWTILYLLIGISLYLFWNENPKEKKGYYLFGIQIFFNALWSIAFFGLKSTLLAFIEIIFLWAAIIGTIFYFHKVNKKSAYLLIPYLLWVTFAALLNFSIILLN